MKYIKTYEVFSWMKRKSKPTEVKTKVKLDIDTISDLLNSDLDGVDFRGVDITTFIKFEECRFNTRPMFMNGTAYQSNDGKPKLSKDNDWFGEEVIYSTTGHRNGSIGILMNYKNDMLQSHFDNQNIQLDLRETFEYTNKIFNLINKERMEQFDIGYCINKHHFIGDGILFYKL